MKAASEQSLVVADSEEVFIPEFPQIEDGLLLSGRFMLMKPFAEFNSDRRRISMQMWRTTTPGVTEVHLLGEDLDRENMGITARYASRLEERHPTLHFPSLREIHSMHGKPFFHFLVGSFNDVVVNVYDSTRRSIEDVLKVPRTASIWFTGPIRPQE
jgi:hypothetical protein